MEAPTRLTTDRSVDGERHPHVHGIADRPPDQGVWPMDSPCKTVALGSGEEHVFLGVVEVLVRQPVLVLRERSVWLHLGVGLERAQVMLEPGHEGDMLD